MSEPMLEINQVTKVFRIGGMLSRKRIKAIDNVSLSITSEQPIILSVVGESGCGKSTLAKMILRIHTPEMGTIRLSGKDYTDRKEFDSMQFRKVVQPIFQNPYESFSPRKTVDSYLYNTALRLKISTNREAARQLIDETLRDVGMSLAVVQG